MAGLHAAAATQLGFGGALSSSFQAAVESRASVRAHGTAQQQQLLCGGCGARSGLRFVGKSSDCKRAVRVNSSSGSGTGGDAGAAALPKKMSSILCQSCDGNGAVSCSQCRGGGVNTEDHFNGRFKAGQTCWLCRGKRQMLCGDCNGAGFIGGFMNTQDE